MTLTKQLLLSGMIVLLCLFVGTNYYVVRNTQSFINDQLASHSQDTATALGLSLTLIMKNEDVVTASRIVDAVWDRGYYRLIEVQVANGSPLVTRSNDVKVYEVPEWFINLLAIEIVKKEAWIMDGWRKVGKVVIESNPGFAYRQIWLTFIDSLKWLLMTSAMAAILGGMLLYIILRPLRAITEQAMQICNQQFITQTRLPWTVDLRQVAQAMNTMSTRLKNLFEEQAKTTEHLREQAYTDPVTKLANRSYFDLQFDYILHDQEISATGILLLIELANFKEYNEKFGFQAGDHLLQNTAHMLANICPPSEKVIITHAKGASFFIILVGKTEEFVQELAAKICATFKEFVSKQLANMAVIGNVGMAAFKAGDTKKNILSQADLSLRAAQAQGANCWHGMVNMQQQALSSSEWASVFATVASENKIVLHYQPIKLWHEPERAYYETLMRLNLSNGQLIAAGIFMPMAEQLGQIITLDKLAIENVINRIMISASDEQYFINLSPSSLDDEHFKKWLLNKMSSLGKKASQLIIELPEYGAVHRLQKMREFFLKFSSFGGKTAIDHYGKNFNSFSYLFNLKLNYLKIDGSFVKNLHQCPENQFFIRALVKIAHSLDIYVIAEAVEGEEEYQILKELGVDGAQGYFVGKPTELQ